MNAALAAALDALEAERLAPVPGSGRAVAVDAADIAAVLEHVAAHTLLARMTADVTGAYARLELAARRHAAPGRADAAGARS